VWAAGAKKRGRARPRRPRAAPRGGGWRSQGVARPAPRAPYLSRPPGRRGSTRASAAGRARGARPPATPRGRRRGRSRAPRRRRPLSPLSPHLVGHLIVALGLRGVKGGRGWWARRGAHRAAGRAGAPPRAAPTLPTPHTCSASLARYTASSRSADMAAAARGREWWCGGARTGAHAVPGPDRRAEPSAPARAPPARATRRRRRRSAARSGAPAPPPRRRRRAPRSRRHGGHQQIQQAPAAYQLP